MKKVVLITGTSSGFGRKAAETMAGLGYRVAATMRDPAGRNRGICEELRSLAGSKGWALGVLDMDVTSEASVNRAVEETLYRFGRIDVVINNAGLGAVGITEAFTPDQFQQVLEVNLLGVVRVNRAVLPAMRRQRSGLLIHVSSAGGRVVLPGLGAYCASKFALEALADVYRFELAPFGIDSVLVEPGIHKTQMTPKSLVAADQERLAAYESSDGPVAKVQGSLEYASSAPETPGPEVVVDSFVHLIEASAGTRPFRTVPTVTMQPLLEAYNAAAKTTTDTVAEVFGIPQPGAALTAHSRG
jgi:NAD(P)-dependent dehydrogenase (short-subunit alcohol dehydrogenase family)